MLLHFDQITTDFVSTFFSKEINVSVLRLDKIHPVISGNKWFKLRYYINEAKEQKAKKIVTFGGAWSNHIIATAAACHLNGITAAGIIRGESPPVLSSTLARAKEYGMELFFLSREEYRKKKIPSELQQPYHYFIPEGGAGPPGIKGASEIPRYCSGMYTHYCCAVGTGTMMAGLIKATSAQQKVIGISVMKNNHDLEKNIRESANTKTKEWTVIHDYHFGGYAKYNPALIHFMNELYRIYNIPSDFVYTGKLFFAIADLIKTGFFPAGSSLLLVHSGGLQGNDSLEKGTLIY